MDFEHVSWLIDATAAFGGALTGVMGLRRAVNELRDLFTKLAARVLRIERHLGLTDEGGG